MKHQDIKGRIWAAHDLLMEETTTRAKFEKIRSLIKGVNKDIDKLLASASQALSKLEKVHQAKVIELTAEHLPESTEKRKKRKKFLLLFIGRWKSLKGEVNRIKKELDNQSPDADPSTTTSTASSLAKIVAKAKGPLGLLTVVAAGVVLLNSTAVTVSITNNGCLPINPALNFPVSIPGLKLPNETIPTGGSAEAILPPLTFAVDNTKSNVVNLNALGLINLDFALNDPGIDVSLNGNSLIGQRTTVNLGSKNYHSLVIYCQ